VIRVRPKLDGSQLHESCKFSPTLREVCIAHWRAIRLRKSPTISRSPGREKAANLFADLKRIGSSPGRSLHRNRVHYLGGDSFRIYGVNCQSHARSKRQVDVGIQLTAIHVEDFFEVRPDLYL